MSEWIESAELATRLDGDLADSVASELIELARLGLVTSRAGSAVLNLGGEIRRLRNWEVPPLAWDAENHVPHRDQANVIVFDMRNGSLKRENFPAKEFYGLQSDFCFSGTLWLDRLAFWREDLTTRFGLPPPKLPEIAPAKTRAPGAGAKTDKERWSHFAAALAVVYDRGEIDLTSENKDYAAVVNFLAERGHTDPLSIDTVRSTLRRFKAWKEGQTFIGDVDFGEGPN